MSSGLSLYHQGEFFYYQNKINEAFECYQNGIKKILKDENVTTPYPFPVPPGFPQEILGLLWQNFVGFFRDPKMNITQDSHPEAYKFLVSFRPSSQKYHSRFNSEQERVLLKGIQVTAALTLGVLAWDKRDRATAAKRYWEAMDVAETYPPFKSPPSGTVGWVLYVHKDLETVKKNLGVLVTNDAFNAGTAAAVSRTSPNVGRREVVNLPFPMVRVDKTGAETLESSVPMATNACASCGRRDPKLQCCSLCRKTFYCNGDCQRADWPVHKTICPGRSRRP